MPPFTVQTRRAIESRAGIVGCRREPNERPLPYDRQTAAMVSGSLSALKESACKSPRPKDLGTIGCAGHISPRRLLPAFALRRNARRPAGEAITRRVPRSPPALLWAQADWRVYKPRAPNSPMQPITIR